MAKIKCSGCGAEIEIDMFSDSYECESCGRVGFMPNLDKADKMLQDGAFALAKGQFSVALELDKECLVARLGVLLCEREKRTIYALVGTENQSDEDAKGVLLTEEQRLISKFSNEAVKGEMLDCAHIALEKGDFEIALLLYTMVSELYPDDERASLGVFLSQNEAKTLAEAQSKMNAKPTTKKPPKEKAPKVKKEKKPLTPEQKAKLKKLLAFSGIGVAVILIALAIIIPIVSSIPRLEFEEYGDGYAVADLTNQERVEELEIPSEYKGKKVTKINNQFIGLDCPVKTISIPDSITEIETDAFLNCKELEAMLVDENNQNYKSIDGNLYTKDGTVLVAYAVKKPQSTFEIPTHVTQIGDSAFSGAKNIKKVTIHSGVTEIGGYAFFGCTSLESIYIPASVTRVGLLAFCECDKLNEIKCGASSKPYGWNINWNAGCNATVSFNINTIENLEYEILDGNVSIIKYSGTKSSVVIPSQINGMPVTEIRESAFANITTITSVEIPDTITTMGVNVFYGCTNLAKICCKAMFQPEGWDVKWRGNCSAKIYWDGVLAQGLYDYVIMENGKVMITKYNGTSVNIEIPKTIDGYEVSTITTLPFSNNTTITSVVLPETLDSVFDNAFANCSSLKTLVIKGENTTIPKSAFSGCSIEKATIPLNMLELIPTGNLKTLAITEGTKNTIDENTFSSVSSLESIDLRISITSLPNGTFQFKKSLKEVKLPSTLLTIESSAFSGCTALTEIVIPEGVTEIQTNAFSGCTALAKVTFPSSLVTIGVTAFSGTISLEVVNLSHCSSLRKIGHHAFNASLSQEMYLPEGLWVNEENNYSYTVIDGQNLRMEYYDEAHKYDLTRSE